MHPHTFFSTLFEHRKRDEVFVIMSFAQEFDDRWQFVIEPCIREDLGLKANRVDYNNSGESIVHDILDGIAHARLVLADITSSPMFDTSGHLWPQRNGNVMWELGIAHVMRVPDEVIVVRSDNDRSIFDLTQFRAFQYDPTEVAEARQFLSTLAKDRIRVVDQAATEHVRRCALTLDFTAYMTLCAAANSEGLEPPSLRTMGDVLGNTAKLPAIARLLDMGTLAAEFPTVTPETFASDSGGPGEKLMKYRATPFGLAVVRYCAQQMGLFSPDLRPFLEGTLPEKRMPSDDKHS